MPINRDRGWYRGWLITRRDVRDGGPWMAVHQYYGSGRHDDERGNDDRMITGCRTANEAVEKIEEYYGRRPATSQPPPLDGTLAGAATSGELAIRAALRGERDEWVEHNLRAAAELLGVISKNAAYRAELSRRLGLSEDQVLVPTVSPLSSPVDLIAELDKCVSGLNDATWVVSRVTNPQHFAGPGLCVTIFAGARQFWEKVREGETLVEAAKRASERASRAGKGESDG